MNLPSQSEARLPVRRHSVTGRSGSLWRWPLLPLVVLGSFLAPPSTLPAQTITGTLMDLDTDRPIDLGLVLLYTEAGDSVEMTVTDERGRFHLTAPDSGSYLLLASALGYQETPAGVFDLGEDGVITVEYRLAPEPLGVEEIVVSLGRPVLQHRLVRNGFVRRLQRGFGAFVTPYEIERASATSTEQLLTHIPGVRVADVRVRRATSERTADQDTMFTMYQRSDIGETVQIRGPTGGWCTPTVYVDGIRSFYTTDSGADQIAVTLSTLAPLNSVEAVEVYRGPSEVPVEYGFGGSGGDRTCGVLVVWTKSGASMGVRVAAAPGDEDYEPLPPVEEEGEPPSAGERVRLQLDREVAERLRLSSPWEGTFLTLRGGDFVVEDPVLGRAVAAPVDGIEALHVERERPGSHAIKRGVVAGAAFAVGMWQFLEILCRTGCEGVLGSAWFPASVTGALVGALVGAQGPGTHWVRAPVPEAEGEAAPGGKRPSHAPLQPASRVRRRR